MAESIHAGHRMKMRNRFIQDKGFENFEDHQILELLLFYANTRSDTNPLAHELLEAFGSLKGVLEARPEQLMQVKGIGEQHTFQAAERVKELMRERIGIPASVGIKQKKFQNLVVFKVFKSFFADEPVTHFFPVPGVD